MVCGDTVHGLDRRTQAQMQARIRHEAGSIGMGAEVSTAELIVQRLEICLRIGLAFLIPISEQLVLPCNHIFCGDLVDFPLAEIREQFCFDDFLILTYKYDIIHKANTKTIIITRNILLNLFIIKTSFFTSFFSMYLFILYH